MPCTDGGVPHDTNRFGYPSYSEACKRNDTLAAENDVLRETILMLIMDPNYKLKPKALKILNEEQIKHRKIDLLRLTDVFKAKRDAEKLGLVMLADPNKPLEPQLGFDPDRY